MAEDGINQPPSDIPSDIPGDIPKADPGHTPGHTPTPDVGRSSTGLEPNIAALLAYVFGVLSGAALWLIEKESPFVKFHAIQSTLLFGGLWLINIVMWKVAWVAALFLGPLVFILWLFLMFKAYKGERFSLPVIGPWADERARLP